MIKNWIPLCTLIVGALLGLGAPASAGFLNGVTSPDGVDVLAVGDSGMVFRSVNGGTDFAKFYQGSTPLRAVASKGGTILIVGDGGKIVRSTNNGINWTTSTASGSPNLFGVELVDANRGWIVGAGGTVLRTINGGANWTTLASGTSNALRNVKFTSGNNGWIVGDGGFIRSTTNAGDSWSPTSLTTPNHLYTIDQNGSRVWAAGANSTCWKSVDSGANWTPVNLRIDSRSDVRAVCLQGADSVFISGGGGFIRRSIDNGASWFFPVHSLLGESSDMFFVGARGWVTSIRSPSVMRTADRGTTWAFAGGTTISRSWSQRQALTAGSQRGSSVALNPVHRNTIYAACGQTFYVSRNDGDSWTSISNIPGTRANALVMSPKDSMKIAIATSSPQQLYYSINGGVNWVLATNGTRAFGEYGIPIEMHPDKPDTLIFGGDNSVLYRSTDFGQSWSSYGSKIFRSPCDLIVVPESDSNAVLVGDGITGSGQGDLWRSTDGGVNFTKHYTTTGSEIPGMSMGRLNNARAFATNWSNGGVEISNNVGLNWTQVATTGSAWGTDVCDEDPNLVIYGVYSGGQSYLSLDGGSTFATNSLSGSNYSFYLRDRNCILAEQGGGIYKLYSTYGYPGNTTQAVNIVAGNGPHNWAAGSTHDITWTSTGLAMARIEWRRSESDSWQLLAEVPGYYNKYAWTLPYVATSEAQIRISDATDALPMDVGSASITIELPLISGLPTSLDFGSQPKGTAVLDSIEVSNDGTGVLHVTSVSTGTANFSAPGAGFNLAAGAKRWVPVTFLPDAAVPYADQLTVTSDGYNTPSLQFPLAGTGEDTLRIEVMTPNGGEAYQYGTTQKVSWVAETIAKVDLHFQVSPVGPWVPIAVNLDAVDGTYDWTIPDAPTSTGRLRVREAGGSGESDVSNTNFSILVPRLDASPTKADFVALTGTTVCDTLHLENPGTGPLTISLITSNHATFTLSRTSLVIPAGESDTVGVCFSPIASGRDTSTLTIVTDDPGTPHTLQLVGVGSSTTGVDRDAPTAFGLWQNQPNPFQRSTVIQYALPRATDVNLEVFNLMGQRVATLVDGPQGAGHYRLNFAARRTDGSQLPAGVYFYRFRAGSFAATRKMLLMN